MPSGVSDLRGAESYFAVRRAPRGEKTSLGAVHRRPQQEAGEICGLVVTADAGQPTRLWRNDSVSDHHWLGLRLEGTSSNRSAIGARVTVRTADGGMVQEVSGGAGRGSQNSLPLEFGLGASAVVEELVVRWPSGITQVLLRVPGDRYLELAEPAASIGPVRRSGPRRSPVAVRGRPAPRIDHSKQLPHE